MDKEDVVIERTFNAPREKVWKTWTDPELVKKWWGPKNFTAPHVELDLRQGGKYLFSMYGAASEGAEKMDYWNAGEYMEVVPMEKIVSSVWFSDEEGKPVPASKYGLPGDWPMETTSEVRFEDVDGKTKITINEGGIPEEMREPTRQGWGESLDKFEAALEK